jgi:hypothetical protein
MSKSAPYNKSTTEINFKPMLCNILTKQNEQFYLFIYKGMDRTRFQWQKMEYLQHTDTPE